MPFGSVTLIPGVDIEKTPTLNEAGISLTQNIRFRDSLVQKIGGFNQFYAFNVAGVPRDLHAWQDLNSVQHLLVGATSSLGIITGSSYVPITPQQLITNPTPNLTATATNTTITVTDPNINNVTVFDSVMFNTPVSIGSTIISGLYQIQAVISSTAFTINAATAALTSQANTGLLPLFTTATSSNLVATNLPNHGIATGGNITFQATTSLAGVTIFGNYPITYTDPNNFTIAASTLATTLATSFMNGGHLALQYFISLGPPPLGSGYGTGGYGLGGYGTGSSSGSQTGNPITVTDWTSDNWGEIILACAPGGPIYQFDPTGAFNIAYIIQTAPPFNNGIFVSNSLQILFAYGSTANASIGQELDPMLIKWSDLSNYTQFQPLTTNQAGSFRIPIGSVIRGGMAVANQNLFWTDLDLWVANYAGYPLVFGFQKIGAGAGLISSHAAQQLRSGIFWMGPSNFYSYVGGGMQVIPCPVWDFVFQNINTSFTKNVRAMPNTPYNEVGWLFPSAASVSGECDSFVKFNITEPGAPWDYGSIARSAWIDQTILGNPIAASPNGVIYQHEMTNDANGQPITSSFTTGYFYIEEGQQFATVDRIIPDFIWGTYAGAKNAQIQVTLNTINYPGDTPISYGPYTMTSTTEYLSVRIRARQMSLTFTSSDLGSFWRIGRVRYQWKPTGRR